MDRLRYRTSVGGHRTSSCIESKTEPSVAKAQDYMGGTPHRKTDTGRGEHRTCFLDWVNNWGVRGEQLG